MQVSFGKFYEINETQTPTRSQWYLNHVIRNAFAQEEDCYAPYSDKCKTVDKLLEEKKEADVIIKNKKDGSVDVEIRRLYSNPDVDEIDLIHNRGYIPFDVRGKQKLKKTNLRLDLSGDFRASMENAQNKMDDFALKCRAYALKADNDKNKLLDEKYEAALERKLERLKKKGFIRF